MRIESPQASDTKGHINSSSDFSLEPLKNRSSRSDPEFLVSIMRVRQRPLLGATQLVVLCCSNPGNLKPPALSRPGCLSNAGQCLATPGHTVSVQQAQTL